MKCLLITNLNSVQGQAGRCIHDNQSNRTSWAENLSEAVCHVVLNEGEHSTTKVKYLTPCGVTSV